MRSPSRLSQILPIGLLLTLIAGPVAPAVLAEGPGPEAGPVQPPRAVRQTTSEPAESLPEGASADWWSTVQEHIVRSEYHVTWQDATYLADLPAAYQAPNRANGLRTYFVSQGPVVIPRTGYKKGDAPPWRWEARLAAWGRPGSMRPASAASLAVDENRVDYERGALAEWYLNDEDGLQTGFTLAVPPPGARGDPLQIELALGGSLVAELAEDSTRIAFQRPRGRAVLAAGALCATDARGRALPAHFGREGAALRLTVDDRHAAYPIELAYTVTGLPASDSWDYIFPQAGAQAGFSLETAGDVNRDGYSDAIVGAPFYDGGDTEEGRVYVFYGSQIGLLISGVWIKEINQQGARFGRSVATAGDVNCDWYSDVIIGAPRFDDGRDNEGGIWVYHGSASGLESSHAWHKQGNQADAWFGYSVSTAGDVNGDGCSDVIIGGPLFDGGQENEGWAWVWHGSGGGLLNSHSWHAQLDGPFEEFGSAVATAGDVNRDGYADVIIGAPEVSVDENNEGAVYVWHGSAGGVNGGVHGTDVNRDWFFRSDSKGAMAGFSVATAGDVNGDGYSDVIFGAPYHTWDGAGQGMVWLSLGGTNGLDDIGKWQYRFAGENPGDNFGWSVATAGDVNGDGYADIVVGAPHYSDETSQRGRAYVWHGSAASISGDIDWDDVGPSTDAFFGNAVATAGDVNGDGYSDVIVGAPGYWSLKGRIFVYHGGPDDPSETAGWTKVSNLEQALFGSSVGTAGDVNGDGYADLIVGAPRWDAGQDLEGGAWVYLGDEGGLQTAPAFYKQSNQDYAEFGASVGTAGDVNGDGYDDIIVGAPYWDDGQDNEGGAWIYRGSSNGVLSAPLWYKQTNHAGGRFGTSVGTAGDVNGDGYADVIVGAPYYNHPSTDEGLAWVYLGGDPAPDTTPDWDGEGNQGLAYYGQAVGTAGDVNGDGYSDIIVGAPGWNGDEINEGRAWVYHGSADGVQEAHAWRQRGSIFNAQYGFAVGTAGDVDGDHYSDIIVGAPYWYDSGQTNEGKVWVYHGSSAGLAFSSSWRREGGQKSAFYGHSVGTAGDVNGDGYADIIIGAKGWSGGQGSEGGASLYYGSRTGLESSRAWHGESDQGNAHYGTSVGTAGDVNGDGYADIVVGAPDYNENHTNEGLVTVYYGNGRAGIGMRITQKQGTHYGPIAHLGRSSCMHCMRVTVRGWTPYGRAYHRALVEIKPIGVPFDGEYGPYAWYDTEDGDTARLLTVTGLQAATLYHWRVRVQYEPATVPYQPLSRWLHMPWNGWQEADFRTGGHRIVVPLVLRNYDP